MASVGMQTTEVGDDQPAVNSTTMEVFSNLLSILDDDERKFYNDLSGELEVESDWSVGADSGSSRMDAMQSENSSSSELATDPKDTSALTTAELEHCVRLSEARLRSNLSQLRKLAPEHQVQQWLESTSPQELPPVSTPPEQETDQ